MRQLAGSWHASNMMVSGWTSLNFDLRVGASDRDTYPVSVIQSPAGEASASLQLPLDDPAFLQSLQTLENVRGTSRGTRIPDTAERDLGVLPTGASELTSVQVVGRALFEALFPPEVLSCYRNSLAAARAQKKCLRVRLRVEAAELSVLPWEFLYDAREGDYVSLLRETPVTRYLEMGLPADPLTIQPPIRILGMVASPNNLPLLDATMERRRMVEAIDHLVESRAVELKWVEGQTWRDLSRTLQEGDWHIFHFIGHGGFSPDLGEGLIALVDEASGGANFLSATQLGRLFAAHPAMRLAVLNACEGARASEHDRFSSAGAVLARRGIPAVVSMQFAITDRAAIEFSRSFYDGLARGSAGRRRRAGGAYRHQHGPGRQRGMGHAGAVHARAGWRPLPCGPGRRHLSPPRRIPTCNHDSSGTGAAAVEADSRPGNDRRDRRNSPGP